MKHCIYLWLIYLCGSVNIFSSNFVKNYYIDEHIVSSPALLLLSKSQENILHIFTHGQPGQLYMEGEWKSTKEIRDFIQESYDLSQFAAIHFYGCNFGQGSLGQLAVNDLELYLGLPVSASNNVTGKDGDWNLEVGRSWRNAMINYPSNLQTCTAHQYKAFAVFTNSDRVYAWTDLSNTWIRIAELFPSSTNPLNHLATDYDRCRLIMGSGGTLNSLYYLSLQNSSNYGVLKRGYLSSLGTSTGGASYYNHTYYFYDDDGTAAGLYAINFDPNNLTDTATPLGPPLKIMDVGGSEQPTGLGDLAIDRYNEIIYVLESSTSSTSPDNGELYKLDLNNIGGGWDLIGVVDLNGDDLGNQLLFDDQGRLLTNNRTAEKWVELSTADASVISQFGNATSASWTDFSNSYTISALPMHLNYFKAKKMDSIIALEWASFSENRNDEFEIEYSMDGIHYYNIGNNAHQDFRENNSKFQFLHRNLPNGVDKIYYRLVQIDGQGKKSMSKAIKVSLSQFRQEVIKIYPTVLQFSQGLNIESESRLKERFKIVNQLGQKMNTEINEIHPKQHITISTEGFRTGLYFVMFENGKSYRFIVQ